MNSQLLPEVLRLIPPRAPEDCAIVCLAMFLGQTYEDVLRAAQQVDYAGGKDGLLDHHIRGIAKTFGHRLTLRKKVDYEEDFGILRLDDHAVVLRYGTVINSSHDGLDYRLTLWDVHDFLSTRPGDVHGVFVHIGK